MKRCFRSFPHSSGTFPELPTMLTLASRHLSIIALETMRARSGLDSLAIAASVRSTLLESTGQRAGGNGLVQACFLEGVACQMLDAKNLVNQPTIDIYI